MVTFLHTADWHLGREYRRVDARRRPLVADARFQGVEALRELAAETDARFVVVAGDLFDSRTPTGAVLAKACEAIGRIGVPVYAIPGNHDPGGPAGPYASPLFREYRERFAPNLRVLDAREPLRLEEHRVVILPCPVVGGESSDATRWLRDREVYAALPADCARLVLAHGSTQEFVSDARSSTRLDIDALPAGELDYVALGDWHGYGAVSGQSWVRYSGTHEPDKFPLSEAYDAGNVLAVRVARAQTPSVEKHRVGRYEWLLREARLRGADDVERLGRELLAARGSGSGRLLRLRLSGTLSIADTAGLDALTAKLGDLYDLVHLERGGLLIEPDASEFEDLARAADPTVRAVAQTLRTQLDDPEQGAVSRRALVKLYEALQTR